MVSRLLDQLVASSANLSAIQAGIIDCLAEGGTPQVRTALELLDSADLLLAYVNWVDGTITQRPREVVMWDGFWRTGRAKDHTPDIARLANLVESGGDLTPYLSHRPYPHKDRALNGYNLHHLHFAPKVGKRRKGESNALLYVRTERHRMHFVTCGDHRSFNDGTLRQAVADYEVARGNYVRGIVGVTLDLSAEEGEDMLRRRANTVAKSGGKWVSPSFLSMAGTSLFATQHVDRMTIAIERWEPSIRTEDGRRFVCEKFGIEYLPSKEFGWGIEHANLYLVDALTRRPVFMVPWHR